MIAFAAPVTQAQHIQHALQWICAALVVLILFLRELRKSRRRARS